MVFRSACKILLRKINIHRQDSTILLKCQEEKATKRTNGKTMQQLNCHWRLQAASQRYKPGFFEKPGL